MSAQSLETDYLVIGAGAMGLAFVDEILMRDAKAHFIIVDKRAKPGGHWNDAYPFVSLHQPAAYYGVNSMNLGTGGSALASGAEVLAYFERVLHKLVGTGRVQHFPMCEYRGNGSFSSIIGPDKSYEVTVRRKTVDGTYMNVEVPSTTRPKYEISPESHVVPLNDLTKVGKPRSGYVIVGAGKTGIDAILFLLAQGVHPDYITWIMSNDSWLMERAGIQPGHTLDWFITQMRIFAESNSLKDVYSSLESEKLFFRIDEGVWPTKFRCATVNRAELKQLRTIKNVVRMGRIVGIEPTEIVLDQGTLPTDSDTLYVDCTADPLAKRDIRPIFDGANITLQSVAMCQQVFSAGLIGYVESHYEDDQKKNELCRVVQHPEFNRDLVPAMVIGLENANNWQRELGGWLRKSRLSYFHHESLWKLIAGGIKAKRLESVVKEKLGLIFEQEFPGREFPLNVAANNGRGGA